MEVAAKLTVFVSCLVVALVAGWALGQIVGALDPALAGPQPGFEYLHQHQTGSR